MSLYPLPDEIKLSDFSGDWTSYKEAVYRAFCDEVVDKLSFLGLPIKCRYFQPIDGMHRTFWHLITTDRGQSNNDEEREVDMRRCEKIRWISHIIRHSDSVDIKCWENKRGSNTNIILWLENENYMIVLSKRKDYYLLITAYTHGNGTKKRNTIESQANSDPRNS
jgi:hypothetical protein